MELALQQVQALVSAEQLVLELSSLSLRLVLLLLQLLLQQVQPLQQLRAFLVPFSCALVAALLAEAQPAQQFPVDFLQLLPLLL